MVLGLLITATASGNIVSKTGRYKVFPVAGGLVMALGLFLLSRMGPETSVLQSSLYLFVLGLGIGLSMQVLTIIVQSSVPYTDLGVATSGVTFFRSMGSAFGASIFGTLYANFLSNRLPAALAQTPTVTQADLSTPSTLHALDDAVIAPIVNAYAGALNQVFLAAAPIALVAFLLALFLPQVKLGGSVAPSASDLGGGFGAPESLSNDEVLRSRLREPAVRPAPGPGARPPQLRHRGPGFRPHLGTRPGARSDHREPTSRRHPGRRRPGPPSPCSSLSSPT